jgi:hypothetical protein
LLWGINEAGLATLAPGGWKVWHYLVAVLMALFRGFTQIMLAFGVHDAGEEAQPSTPRSELTGRPFG